MFCLLMSFDLASTLYLWKNSAYVHLKEIIAICTYTYFRLTLLVMQSYCKSKLLCYIFQKTNVYLEGYPAALILMVSNTPQALSCCIARLGSKVNAIFSSLGLIHRI